MGKGSKSKAKVVVDFTNPVNLIQALQMLSANDTSTIKTAEKALKPFLKEHGNAVLLINILRTCPEVPVRHHAALMLRKRLAKFYPKYLPSEKLELKNILLQIFLSETASEVATAIAGAIAATAEGVFKAGETWEDLFNLLIRISQEPEERLRVLSFRLLSEVTIFPFN
jgi:hypothetical protein